MNSDLVSGGMRKCDKTDDGEIHKGIRNRISDYFYDVTSNEGVQTSMRKPAFGTKLKIETRIILFMVVITIALIFCVPLIYYSIQYDKYKKIGKKIEAYENCVRKTGYCEFSDYVTDEEAEMHFNYDQYDKAIPAIISVVFALIIILSVIPMWSINKSDYDKCHGEWKK